MWLAGTGSLGGTGRKGPTRGRSPRTTDPTPGRPAVGSVWPMAGTTNGREGPSGAHATTPDRFWPAPDNGLPHGGARNSGRKTITAPRRRWVRHGSMRRRGRSSLPVGDGARLGGRTRGGRGCDVCVIQCATLVLPYDGPAEPRAEAHARPGEHWGRVVGRGRARSPPTWFGSVAFEGDKLQTAVRGEPLLAGEGEVGDAAR
jgi:hypothetical protein